MITAAKEVVILKVHGSIDWFDRTEFEGQIAQYEDLKAPPPSHIIFSDESTLELERLIDGPCYNANPLKNIFRARNLKALYQKDLLFRATPRMLSPSTSKLVYVSSMNDFWRGMGHAGLYNFGMAIVGFSLPQQDDYARQILYQCVTNYQRYNWPKDDVGREKTPLAIVDFFPDGVAETQFRERYRFVDWSRAKIDGEGFDLKSFDIIFS